VELKKVEKKVLFAAERQDRAKPKKETGREEKSRKFLMCGMYFN